MPGTNDTDNQPSDEFDDESIEDETEEKDEEADADSDEDSDLSQLDAKAQKRIKDFQSKADAAEARANKAEKALKAASAGKPGDGGDPNTKALMQEVREASLDAIFAEYPQLKQYGIDRGLIEGDTRGELRESASNVVALIKSVTNKVRNETLAEHGLTAPATGSTRKPPANYGTMSEDDFKKLLDSM